MARRWSHTQMCMIEECELKWYNKYIKRVAVPENPIPFIIGSGMHNALEVWLESGVWHKDPKNARPILRELIEKFIQKELDPWPLLDFPEEWVKEAPTFVDTIVEGIKKHGLLSKRLLIEPTYIPILTVCEVYVKPDLVTFRNDGTVKVTDFKSSRTNKYLHDSQLELYAYGLQQAEGMDVAEAGFFMLRTGKWISVDVSNKREVESRVKKRINAAFLRGSHIEKGGSLPKPNPGSHCQDCDFHKKCEHAPDGVPEAI